MPEIKYGRHVNHNWTPKDVRKTAERRRRLGFVPIHAHIPLAAPTTRVRPKEEIKEIVTPPVVFLIPAKPDEWRAPTGQFVTLLTSTSSNDDRFAAAIKALDDGVPDLVESLAARHIIGVVARAFSLSFKEIEGHCREKCYTIPRQMAVCLAAVLTRQSTSAISRIVNKDHTTLMHAHETRLLQVINAVKDHGSAALIAHMERIIANRGAKFRAQAAIAFYELREAAE